MTKQTVADELTLQRGEYVEVTGPNIGDPVFPAVMEVRHFRRDDEGQRLLVGKRRYRLVEIASSGDQPDQI